jgi:hypothetical protein
MAENGRREDPRFLRAAGKRMRATDEARMRLEKERVDEGESPWQIYRTDINKYISSFENVLPGTRGRVRRKIERAHARGEKVVVLEIGGCADAASLGADKTIAMGLPEPETAEGLERRKLLGAEVKRQHRGDSMVILRGSVLSHRGLHELIREVREELPKQFPGEKISVLFAFIFAGGAAREHATNIVSRSKFARLLSEVHNTILGEDGETYAELTFADRPIRTTEIEEAVGDENASVVRAEHLSMFRISKATSSE